MVKWPAARTSEVRSPAAAGPRCCSCCLLRCISRKKMSSCPPTTRFQFPPSEKHRVGSGKMCGPFDVFLALPYGEIFSPWPAVQLAASSGGALRYSLHIGLDFDYTIMTAVRYLAAEGGGRTYRPRIQFSPLLITILVS